MAIDPGMAIDPDLVSDTPSQGPNAERLFAPDAEGVHETTIEAIGNPPHRFIVLFDLFQWFLPA